MKKSSPTPDPTSRRAFLAFLAGSPLLAVASLDPGAVSAALAERGLAGLMDLTEQASQEPTLIGSPGEALNVFDFEPVAKKNLPAAHWGYLATGTDDDGTLRANRAGFEHFALRARRLMNVTKLDLVTELAGTRWDTPIVICPVGSQKAFHPEGEIAVARAAKAKGHLQVLSTVATTSIEDAIAARGAPVWFQLYCQTAGGDATVVDWDRTRQLVKRVERAGAPAIALTVDQIGLSNRETMLRERRRDTRTCSTCHANGAPLPGMRGVSAQDNRRKPNISGFTPVANPEVLPATWDVVKRIKDTTTTKLFVKGIVTREDAEVALANGVDGVWVSNHGGRAENSGRATIDCLPEISAAVAGRVPIIIDSGFRRGTDIFKGLALGATGVGVGRPYIWGLASFGQEGVEAVLAMLRRELEMVMRQSGTPTVKSISKEFVVSRNT